MTNANKITEAKKAFARDPYFKRIKKVFTTKRSKPVTKKGKKR